MKKISRVLQTVAAALIVGIMLFASPVSAAIQRSCPCNSSVTTTYGSARTRCGVNGGTYSVYARASSQYNFASNALNDTNGLRRLYVSSYNTTENVDSQNFGGILSGHYHPASFGQTSR